MSKTMTSKRHQVGFFLPKKTVVDVSKNVKAANGMKRHERFSILEIKLFFSKNNSNYNLEVLSIYT
jgi:hypothetical protein